MQVVREAIRGSKGLFIKNWFGVSTPWNVRGGKHNAKCVSTLIQPHTSSSSHVHAREHLDDPK